MLIRDGVIEVVSGCRISLDVRKVLDGGGLYLSPGFIDLHSQFGISAPEFHQGVTTEVTYGESVREGRKSVLFTDAEELLTKILAGPTREKAFRKMRSLLSESFDRGSKGLSLDLSSNGKLFSQEELLLPLEIVSMKGKLVSLHVKESDRDVLGTLTAVLNLAFRARCRLHVVYEGISSERNEEVEQLIRNAREKGLEVFFDLYPKRVNPENLTFLVKELSRKPAVSLSLEHQGILREGYVADMVLYSLTEDDGFRVADIFLDGLSMN